MSDVEDIPIVTNDINEKYLMDELGNVMSPVTRSQTVYSDSNTTLQNIIEQGTFSATTIYSGETTSSFTLTDSIFNYEYCLIECMAYYSYQKIFIFKVIQNENQYYQLDKISIVSSASTWFGTTAYFTISKTAGTSVTVSGSTFNCWNHSYDSSNDMTIKLVQGLKRMS